jgi:DNA segregation ATPase FtsK/SpoIIIE, S-DNA-T family
MLSWIKKLFQMFSGEEERNPDSKKREAAHSPQPREHQSFEMKKELDAKVLYQYPKGQFKFPLIPDKTPRERESAKPNRRPPAQVKTMAEEMEPVKPKTRDKVEKHAQIKPSRQPFRPTETPSPIFAFNRPRQQDADVEYELKDFSREAQLQGSSARAGSAWNAQREADERKWEAVSKIRQERIPEEAEAVSAEEPGYAVEQEPAEEPGYAVEQEPSVEPGSPLEQEPAGEPVTAAGISRSVEWEEAIPAESPEPFSKNEVFENWDGDTETLPAEDQHLDQEVKGQEEQNIEDEQNHEEENFQKKENNSQFEAEIQENDKGTFEIPNRGKTGVIAANETAEDLPSKEEDPQADRESAPQPQKRHLPFNVLMLKQDKRKLETRKKESPAPSPAAVEPPKLQNKDIIEEEETNDVKETAQAYEFPPLDLLNPPVSGAANQDWLQHQEQLLNETLKNFNVGARVVNVTQGPSVTRFEVQPEPGVKVNKITNLSDDIKLSLAAKDIRIEAPIPGKHTIGIEVPNASSRPVLISEILQTSGFESTASPLAVALGLDIAGSPIVTDLKKMPHGLIAGATGSGKSVCINTMLVSLLYKAHPDDVKLLLIDPKMVELAPYNYIPHLVSPVITDVKAATASLKWAVEEMERRYELFAHTGVRDIGRFNELALEHKSFHEKLPYIVIIIDELADLMMMSPADVEEAICRIAQKARACGIHLIIATQRPSVDVITGLIKANVPTRVAFSVSSQVDSRTIIDISGAEKLLGRGDMLFLENGSSKPYRLQGTFVSDREIDEVVAFVREQRAPDYLFEQDELLRKSQLTEEEDELFFEACSFVIEQGGASTSSIQRRFKVGYNRAARLIDMMEQHGFISEARGSKPRDVLISASDLESFQETSTLA